MIHFVGHDAAGVLVFFASAPDQAARDAWPAPAGGGLLTITAGQLAAVRAGLAAWKVEDGELVAA